MSAIVPPLDKIPNLPGIGVSKILAQINKQLDKLISDIQKVVKDSVKLPADCGCNDPRIAEIKKKLEAIQKQMDAINKIIPNVQRLVKTLKTITTTAMVIKTTLAAIQLLNPITAPVFIAQQLTLIQDATIVNALESIKLLRGVPNSMASSLAASMPPLASTISQISSICNEKSSIVLPKSVVDSANDGLDTGDDGRLGLSDDDYNDLIDTEFYTKLNVSDSDLSDRADAIQQLVEQQQNLLTSLREAPAKVFQNNVAPDPNLGKVGDFYVNTATMMVFIKTSSNQWTAGI